MLWMLECGTPWGAKFWLPSISVGLSQVLTSNSAAYHRGSQKVLVMRNNLRTFRTETLAKPGKVCLHANDAGG